LIEARDHDAYTRAIAWMRKRSLKHTLLIEAKLDQDGFETAGQFAAFTAQCETLKLHPCQAPPCAVLSGVDPDPYVYGRRLHEIALRDAILDAGLSVYEPDIPGALDRLDPGDAAHGIATVG
jgi:hypothetical protein